MSGWPHDCLAGWMYGWMTAYLVDCLSGWPHVCLAGWMHDWMTGYLVDYLSVWLASCRHRIHVDGWGAHWRLRASCCMSCEALPGPCPGVTEAFLSIAFLSLLHQALHAACGCGLTTTTTPTLKGWLLASYRSAALRILLLLLTHPCCPSPRPSIIPHYRPRPDSLSLTSFPLSYSLSSRYPNC